MVAVEAWVNGAEEVCALAEVVGSVPSVVYLTAWRPAPPTLSLELSVTVTAVRFQPAPFAAGDCEAVVVGAVMSLRSVSALAAVVLPATSAAVAVSVGDDVVPAVQLKLVET